MSVVVGHGCLSVLQSWDVSQWSLEDVLEAGGACVVGRGAFNVWCKETGRWEVLTQEYVQGLAAYLAARVAQLRGARGLAHHHANNTTVVLEVGAGRGELAHWLGKELARHQPDISYVATDHSTPKQPFTTVHKYDDRQTGRQGLRLGGWQAWLRAEGGVCACVRVGVHQAGLPQGAGAV